MPEKTTREYLLGLAETHGVTYTATAGDALANTITALADDEVTLDEVEKTLIALERAGVIAGNEVVPLHVRYLREKFAITG